MGPLKSICPVAAVLALQLTLSICELTIVDLTHLYSPETPMFPGNPQLNMSNLKTIPVNSEITFEINWYSSPEHLGTHLDAPSHFYPGNSHIHEIPLEKLIGPGVIIDVSAKAAVNADYQVTVQDLQDWESTHGRIPDGAVVMMNSGWTKKWPNLNLVFGTDNPPAQDFHFPSFHVESVEWLINNRNISLLGVDSPSIDYGQTAPTRPVHVTLLAQNIPAAENVANLDQVPASGATIYLPVYKLYKGSGAPVRIFATYDKDAATNAGDTAHGTVMGILGYSYLFVFVIINLCVAM